MAQEQTKRGGGGDDEHGLGVEGLGQGDLSGAGNVAMARETVGWIG